MNRLKRVWLLAGMSTLCAGSVAAPSPPPGIQARAGYQQRLGALLPMAEPFTDATGRRLSLRQWIGGRPALLMLGYFRCPHLCDVAEQGMAHAIGHAGLQPGHDLNVLFISIDPRDTPASAAAKQAMIADMPGNANARAWHFLVGAPPAIAATANSVGFHYFYDARLDEYAHPAGLVIATADGRVNQYLMGVNYLPQTLRLAAIAASGRRLGSITDQLVLLCCGYDPSTGRYTVSIERIMQGLGLGFVILLLGMFMLLQRRGRGTPP
jgi:protein SCO1/2